MKAGAFAPPGGYLMAYYLTHPEHGIHICYTLEDVEKHKQIGWVPVVKPEKPTETLTLPKRGPGRPKKVDK